MEHLSQTQLWQEDNSSVRLSRSVMSGAHVCRHFRLWQIQASQKSQMAPTSAMPVAFLPPCGTQQSLPRHLRISTI